MKTSLWLLRKPTLLLAAGLACLSLTGCTDFKNAWEEQLKKPRPVYTDLTGPWEGTWKSDVNGHNGKLRCIITKQKDGAYEFHYWAQWQKVLSGSFKQNYAVEVDKAKPGTFRFEGARDLGKMGGKFTHKGVATATTLKATYDSEMGDKGVFELTRPKSKTEPGAVGEKE
jgi:hypothetical protein